MSDKESARYQALWNEYGKVLKEGIVEDQENQKLLTKLLRFATTRCEVGVQETSLDDYVKRMPMKQKEIYFITAESEGSSYIPSIRSVQKKRNRSIAPL